MCDVLNFPEICFLTKFHIYIFPDLTAHAHGPSTKSPVKASTHYCHIFAQAVREANANADALLLEEEEEAERHSKVTSKKRPKKKKKKASKKQRNKYCPAPVQPGTAELRAIEAKLRRMRADLAKTKHKGKRKRMKKAYCHLMEQQGRIQGQMLRQDRASTAAASLTYIDVTSPMPLTAARARLYALLRACGLHTR